MKFILSLIIIMLLFGCGKSERPDSTQDDKVTMPSHSQTPVPVNSDVMEGNPNIVQDVKIVPADLFFSESYLKSAARFDEFIENTYMNLAYAEFISASQELIDYRKVLSNNQELASWLLASSIEGALSKGILKRLEEGNLPVSDAKELIDEYQGRFYSIDGIAAVFDEEIGVKRGERFTSTEQDLLKEKVRLKNPKTATEQHRYRALSEHVTAVTGGLSNQVKIDWAGDMYALVALSKLYEAHKQTVMASIYVDHLNGGGVPLDEPNIEVFKNEISDYLSPIDLPEFAAFGSGRVTPSDLVRFIQNL